MQIVHTQGADGIRGVAVEVDQCLKAVLLAAVEQPVDGALAGAGDRVGLAVILEKVVHKVVADDLPAGAALIAQCFCNKVKVFFQRSCTVYSFQPVAQAGNNIIVQIFFIGDGDDIIFVREEHLIYHNPFITVCTLQFLCRNRSGAVVQLIRKRLQGIWLTCKKQAIFVGRVAAKHTAYSIRQQRHNFITVSACIVAVFHAIRHFITVFKYPVHRYVLIFHFRGQFVLQAVNINKNAVQLFFVFFQLLEP